jgi:hypothetical protein
MCLVRVWCSGEGLLIRVVSVVDIGSAEFGPGGGDRAAGGGGNSNRARNQMYCGLARLRQAMNQVEHIEQFPA